MRLPFQTSLPLTVFVIVLGFSVQATGAIPGSEGWQSTQILGKLCGSQP